MTEQDIDLEYLPDLKGFVSRQGEANEQQDRVVRTAQLALEEAEKRLTRDKTRMNNIQRHGANRKPHETAAYLERKVSSSQEAVKSAKLLVEQARVKQKEIRDTLRREALEHLLNIPRPEDLVVSVFHSLEPVIPQLDNLRRFYSYVREFDSLCDHVWPYWMLQSHGGQKRPIEEVATTKAEADILVRHQEKRYSHFGREASENPRFYPRDQMKLIEALQTILDFGEAAVHVALQAWFPPHDHDVQVEVGK